MGHHEYIHKLIYIYEFVYIYIYIYIYIERERESTYFIIIPRIGYEIITQSS